MRYNRTSLAYDIDEHSIVDDLVSEAKKETPVKKKNNRLFAFVCVVYVVAMIASLLVKTANINEQKTALTNIKNEYNNILNENKKLEVTINSQIDLRKVEEIAIAQLGMNKPKQSQTVYLSTEPKDYGEVFIDSSKEKAGGNIFASLVKSLNGIFTYSN